MSLVLAVLTTIILAMAAGMALHENPPRTLRAGYACCMSLSLAVFLPIFTVWYLYAH